MGSKQTKLDRSLKMANEYPDLSLHLDTFPAQTPPPFILSPQPRQSVSLSLPWSRFLTGHNVHSAQAEDAGQIARRKALWRLGPSGRRKEAGAKHDLIPSYINEHHRRSYLSTIRSSYPEAGRLTDNSNSQATKMALASRERPA